jgi:hypothetical protein
MYQQPRLKRGSEFLLDQRRFNYWENRANWFKALYRELFIIDEPEFDYTRYGENPALFIC